jgi:hypothetical protein
MRALIPRRPKRGEERTFYAVVGKEAPQEDEKEKAPKDAQEDSLATSSTGQVVLHS